MKVMKVRRVGDSNLVAIPKEFEALGYTPGDRVLVEALPTGELLIRPAEQLRARMDDLARRVVEENREAFDILAAHDAQQSPKAPA